MIKFLIKGLLRDKSRSLFPVIIIATGVFLTVLMQSWIRGVYDSMLDTTARYSTGHVKVMSKSYSKLSAQMPNDLALYDSDDLTAHLGAKYSNLNWLERIKFGALLDVPDKSGETRAQGPVFGLGVDVLSPESKEDDVLRIRRNIVKGKPIRNRGEALVSLETAKKLSINLGDEVTIIGSTMNGSMAMYNFKVVGFVKFGIAYLDKALLIVDIKDARLALDMDNATSEIVGYFKNYKYNNEDALNIKKEFNSRLYDENDPFSPLMFTLGDQDGMQQMIDASNYTSTIIVTIFVSFMALILWNTSLIGGIRRYGEVGLRIALGEGKNGVYKSMIYESIVLGVSGSFIGTLIGLAGAYFLQEKGLYIGYAMKNASIMMSDVMNARITFETFYIGFLPGIFAPVLGTVFAGVGIYRRQTAQLFKELEV